MHSARLLLGAVSMIGAAGPTSAGGGTYGSGIGGDALANVMLGGTVGPRLFFVRFRAEQSSTLQSVTFPFLSADYPGYGGGTGGEWKLGLFADDGTSSHFPSGPALASEPQLASTESEPARVITFSPAPAVSEGAVYHLIFENTDAMFILNFFSINNWARLSFTEGGQLNPRYSMIDWGCGYWFLGSWHDFDSFCPIVDLEYGNGAHQGMSYGDASYLCPEDDEDCVNEQLVGRIDGHSNMVRELFTVSGREKTVRGVGVRVLRTPGTESKLSISLRNSADQAIETVTVLAAEVAVGPGPTYQWPATWDDVGQNARWVTANFAYPHVLNCGETYSLRLSSTTGTYWAWVMRGLTPFYGYSSPTAFADGWSEYTTDGTTWKSLGRVEYENDLQFYFMTPCASDLSADGVVDGNDLGMFLGAWGTTCSCACAADLDENGAVDGGDLGVMLGSWGPCE